MFNKVSKIFMIQTIGLQRGSSYLFPGKLETKIFQERGVQVQAFQGPPMLNPMANYSTFDWFFILY